jgi:hypothetical protein
VTPPWRATPEDVAQRGVMRADYGAFERWWLDSVEGRHPAVAAHTWGELDNKQKVYVYAALIVAFDATRPAGEPESSASDETNCTANERN